MIKLTFKAAKWALDSVAARLVIAAVIVGHAVVYGVHGYLGPMAGWGFTIGAAALIVGSVLVDITGDKA